MKPRFGPSLILDASKNKNMPQRRNKHYHTLTGSSHKEDLTHKYPMQHFCMSQHEECQALGVDHWQLLILFSIWFIIKTMNHLFTDWLSRSGLFCTNNAALIVFIPVRQQPGRTIVIFIVHLLNLSLSNGWKKNYDHLRRVTLCVVNQCCTGQKDWINEFCIDEWKICGV